MATKTMTLELVPMDPSPAADGEPAKPAPEASPAPGTAAPAPAADPTIEFVAPGAAPIDLDATQPIHADRYLREATLQYQEGHIDAPLWDRALAQADGDKERAAKLYVERRAIALRMLERERRGRRPDGGAAPPRTPTPATAAPSAGPVTEFGDDDDLRHLMPEPWFARHRIALIAAGALATVAVVAWVAVGFFGSSAPDPVATPAAVAVAPAKAPARAPAAPKSVPPATASPAPVSGGAGADLLAKIDELREAKNWNLLVLYLVEWTRRDPTNVDAWNQLRAGYVTLRQYDEALTAAKKAVELAPADAALRARVGDVHVYRDDPAAALAAFEEAAARDAGDADIRIRIGLLHAQLGRSAEGKAALDSALGLAPGDPLALCVRTGIAQMTTSPGDTYGRAREARAIDAKCRGH